jgi:hypothetical protein
MIWTGFSAGGFWSEEGGAGRSAAFANEQQTEQRETLRMALT